MSGAGEVADGRATPATRSGDPGATDAPLYRITSCPACDGSAFTPLIQQKPGRHLHLDATYDIQRCVHCGMACVVNPPSAAVLSGVYDRHFFSTSQQVAPVDERGQFTADASRSPIYLNAERRVRDIAARKSGGRLLDVGCGRGYFLKVASRHFSVTGNELSAVAAAYGRDTLGLEIVEGDFLRAELPTGAFDVVTLWDSLASMGDPRAVICRVCDLLTPGGLFVFTVPDIESRAFRIAGRYWPLLIPPINLYYYGRESTRRLLGRYGMNMTHFGHDGKYVSTRFIVQKLGRILGLRAFEGRRVGIPLVRMLYLNLGDIATVCGEKGGDL